MRAHPSAEQDTLTSWRHRAFVVRHLAVGLVAIVILPIFLMARGVPSMLELLAFACLVAPVFVACYLSRTGNFENAHGLSSLCLTGLITVVATGTGGIGTLSPIWLTAVPLEAALSGSRRAVAVASTIALTAAGLMLLVDAFDLMPAGEWGREQAALAALGIAAAALYAAGLAFAAESLARTGFWLLSVEEDRYRRFARSLADCHHPSSTRHRSASMSRPATW